MSGFDMFNSRLIIEGVLEARGPLHVGAGRTTGAIETDLPVVKDALGNPVIPGSSLKGALRSHLEMILRAIQPDNASKPGSQRLVCDPLSEVPSEACLTDPGVDQIKKQIHDPVQRDAELLSRTCLMCRVFGAPWVSAKLKIRDLPLIPGYGGERTIIRDGVSIDRDKGTAKEGAKFDFEVVPAYARFALRLQLDNANDVEQGLVFLGVQALEREQILIGGSHRAGAGWCRLVDVRYMLFEDPVEFLVGSTVLIDMASKVRGFLAFAQGEAS